MNQFQDFSLFPILRGKYFFNKNFVNLIHLSLRGFFLAMDFLNHFRPAVSSEHLPCTLFNFDRLWRTTYSKLEGGGGDGPVLVTSSLLTMGKFKKIPRTDI